MRKRYDAAEELESGLLGLSVRSGPWARWVEATRQGMTTKAIGETATRLRAL